MCGVVQIWQGEESNVMGTNKGDKILLAHGGGGRLSDKFIQDHIVPKLENEILSEMGDSARL